MDVSATIFSLGIIRHCWNLDKKKCMTPMNDLLFSFSLINKFVWFKYEAKIIHVILCPFCVGFFSVFLFDFFFTLKIMYIVLDSADLHYMSIRISALRLALLCQESHPVVWVLSI